MKFIKKKADLKHCAPVHRDGCEAPLLFTASTQNWFIAHHCINYENVKIPSEFWISDFEYISQVCIKKSFFSFFTRPYSCSSGE